jgi:glycosyltransferase involved in cell wall biosynthesis
MKILFISNLYPPNTVGGYERLCFRVAEAFADRNHQVSVLTSSYGGKEQSYPNQSIDRSLRILASEDNIYQIFNGSPEEILHINLRNVERFNERILAEEPDVLFVWNLYFFDRSLLDAIQRTTCKSVFLLTDNWLISFLNAPFLEWYFAEYVLSNSPFDYRKFSTLNRVLKRFRYLFFNLFKKKAIFPILGDAIFASNFMKELYTQAGILFSSSTVIYHGVNLIDPDNDQYADRFSLLYRGELRLLFAGRIVELKGAHTVIEALPSVIRALPELHVKLTVLGERQDQEYVKRLKELIQKLDLSANVELRPPVSELELFKLFQMHDLYLFPSLYEPFSLTLIHALHSGIPTISSNAGGNKEIVHHGETGLLFRAGNALELSNAVVKLIRNPGVRGAISHSARKVARDYTFERMVKQIEGYLGSVCGDSTCRD